MAISWISSMYHLTLTHTLQLSRYYNSNLTIFAYSSSHTLLVTHTLQSSHTLTVTHYTLTHYTPTTHYTLTHYTLTRILLLSCPSWQWQAVGLQFEPNRWRPCGSSRTVVVITSALGSDHPAAGLGLVTIPVDRRTGGFISFFTILPNLSPKYVHMW